MNKLQNTILVIASEIKRICEKYDIRYYIWAGTLLGAVRHKGFIPWDDDFDILMRRNDFERFIKICQTELDANKYFLQWEGSEEYFGFAFAKLRLKDTKMIEDFTLNLPIQNGIFADIMPIDNLPDNPIRRQILKGLNHIMKNIIWIKCGYGSVTHGNVWWYKILKIISRPFSIKWLKKKRYKLITKYREENTKECFVSDFPHKVNYNNSWFEEIREYDFEDKCFMGVLEYDKFLTLLYGDYMKLPPENEQIRHSEYEIDYGPYAD